MVDKSLIEIKEMENLLLIIEATGVNVEWLLTGKGKMDKKEGIVLDKNTNILIL